MQAPISFSRKDEHNFFNILRTRVNDYFSDNQIKKKGSFQMYFKTIVMLALYFVPYSLMLFGMIEGWAVLGVYLVMGLGMSGIGLCVMHDANHGAYSKRKWVNQLIGYSLDMVGGSSFTWKIQHNLLHHTYTNVYEMDEDIDDKPFLRLSLFGKWKKHHRFQQYYAFLLYCFATVSWVIMKDWKQLFRYNKNGLTEKNGFNPTHETIIMILAKVLYFFHILVLPILLGVSWGLVLLGFLLLHMLSGFVITMIFQLAHVVEGPDHHAVEEGNMIENTWAIHQLHTTANFTPKNRFITWFVGGLNFQIEHHLFPSICHIHYPEIAKIVKSTAKEFNLPYYEFPKLHGVVASHYRMLKLMGSGAVA